VEPWGGPNQKQKLESIMQIREFPNGSESLKKLRDEETKDGKGPWGEKRDGTNSCGLEMRGLALRVFGIIRRNISRSLKKEKKTKR